MSLWDSDGKPAREAFRHARTTDPSTSFESAVRAIANANDRRAALLVWRVMVDGVPRIDEEIDVAVRLDAHKRGEACPSADRLRHGRQLLATIGNIKLTGERRRTSRGGTSREWIAVT